jgi:hypothetical protein
MSQKTITTCDFCGSECDESDYWNINQGFNTRETFYLCEDHNKELVDWINSRAKEVKSK